MPDKYAVAPEHTAVRVALWRALHVLIDAKPHVLTDEVGAKLVREEGWRNRSDMHPEGCRRVRASIVLRARFIEELIEREAKAGVQQYVILGAGLDSFAQRRLELASELQIFEVDQPGSQAWKRQRLFEEGYSTPAWLHFVPVDFEAGQSWWQRLKESGFDPQKPAVVVSTGVSMYLTREANLATLNEVVALAPGSTFATTYMFPHELLEVEDQPGQLITMKYAAAAGTPFISFFAPPEILRLAKEVGFKSAQCVTPADMRKLYLNGRVDGLMSASGEFFLVAKT